jgi:hypothetical protein
VNKCRFNVKKVKVKVKQYRNRPGVAQKVPGGLGSQIFKKLGSLRW